MRKLLVAVLLLIGLLVVADRVAEHVAEGQLADQLTGELGTRPSVEIGGFPFLTQALRGSYGDLQVRADRVVRNGLTLQDLAATLTDAQVPLRAALRGDVDTVPVRTLAVSGLVPYAELDQLSGRDLTLAPGPGGGVVVSGTVRLLGVQVQAEADSTVQVQDGRLAVRAAGLRVGGVAATAAQARLLGRTLDLDIRVPDLPYGLQLSTVRGTADGVVVAGTRADAVLTR